MRAILIDPFSYKIMEVDVDGSLASIYSATQCSLITSVEMPNEDVMFLDDEGLFVQNQAFFSIYDMPRPLAGRALVLGCAEGEMVGSRNSLAEISLAVRWVSRESVAMMSDDGAFDIIISDGKSSMRVPCRPEIIAEDR